MESIRIGERQIGPGRSTYMIAEMSGNHNQSLDRALAIIQEAKRAGADAVKLQTYTADTITIESERPEFQIRGTALWDGLTLHGIFGQAFTPWEWHARLQEEATQLGMDLFSTPFDDTAVDFLEDLSVPAYKIASPELIDIPLLERIATTKKPIIMSTGMASIAEIDEAMSTIRRVDDRAQVVLLKCTAAYPAPLEEMNLRAIPLMEQVFGVPVGLSDHTFGSEATIGAVALGACVIEKHLTLARSDGGPDAGFSMEPDEMLRMVDSVRKTEKALGKPLLGPSGRERPNHGNRRSLYVIADIAAGESITRNNVRSIRPGLGLHTRYYEEVLKMCARTALSKGTPLAWTDIEAPQA